jgi:Protein of unknown function (DUF2846)
MGSNLALRTWLGRAAGYAVVLLLVGCIRPAAAPAAAASVAPLPAGSARIWFYRDYEPYVSLNMAPVSLNGRLAGYVQADGSAFYRDVPPGHYHISVESAGTDVNQDKDVDLAAGQEAFVKILSLSSWESDGDIHQYHRDTFYVSLVPPQTARGELANHPLSGG